jgi:hypothetical protein
MTGGRDAPFPIPWGRGLPSSGLQAHRNAASRVGYCAACIERLCYLAERACAGLLSFADNWQDITLAAYRSASAFTASTAPLRAAWSLGLPRAFIVALTSEAAAVRSRDQLSRDFLGCPIFDFCNNICQQRKSVDLSITSSADSSSTRLSALFAQGRRDSASSGHFIGPIAFLASVFGLTGQSKRNLINV